jgi:hypothetical protein
VSGQNSTVPHLSFRDRIKHLADFLETYPTIHISLVEDLVSRLFNFHHRTCFQMPLKPGKIVPPLNHPISCSLDNRHGDRPTTVGGDTIMPVVKGFRPPERKPVCLQRIFSEPFQKFPVMRRITEPARNGLHERAQNRIAKTGQMIEISPYQRREEYHLPKWRDLHSVQVLQSDRATGAVPDIHIRSS